MTLSEKYESCMLNLILKNQPSCSFGHCMHMITEVPYGVSHIECL